MLKIFAIIAIIFAIAWIIFMVVILCKAASIVEKTEEDMYKKYFEEEHEYKEEDF